MTVLYSPLESRVTTLEGDSRILIEDGTTIDLYVDVDNGSDSNDGLTSANGVQTISAFKNLIKQYFLAGGTLRLNFAGNNTTNFYNGFHFEGEIAGGEGRVVFRVDPAKTGILKWSLFSTPFIIRNINPGIIVQLDGLQLERNTGAFVTCLEIRNIGRLETTGTNLFGETVNLVDIDLIDMNSSPKLKVGTTTVGMAFTALRCKFLDCHVELDNSSRIVFTNCTGSVNNIDITDDGIASGNPYVAEFYNCANMNVNSTINYNSKVHYRYLFFDSCDNFEVNNLFAGDGGALSFDAPIVDILYSHYINFVSSGAHGMTAGFTGLTTGIRLDANSLIKVADTTYDWLPFDGATEFPAGSIVNAIDAVEVTYDNASSGLTASDMQAAIDEIRTDSMVLKGAYNPTTNTPNIQATETQLTGTVDVLFDENVSGSGTLFTTELAPGDNLKIGSETRIVDTITNDTTLTTTVGYTIGAFGSTASKVDNPTEPIKTGDVYSVSAEDDFYGQTINEGDLLIALTDDATDSTGWLAVNKNLNDFLYGLKPSPPFGSRLYINPDTGDDANDGNAATPVATFQRLQQLLNQYNWNGFGSPFRIRILGTPTNFGLDFSNVTGMGDISFEFQCSSDFANIASIENVTDFSVDITGTINENARITFENCRNVTVGLGGNLEINGGTGNSSTSVIKCVNIQNGVFLGSSDLAGLNITGTGVLYDFVDVDGKIEFSFGTFDTIAAGQTIQTFSKYTRCENVLLDSVNVESFTGRLIDATDSIDLEIDDTGWTYTGSLANLYPTQYVLNGTPVIEYDNTTSGLDSTDVQAAIDEIVDLTLSSTGGRTLVTGATIKTVYINESTGDDASADPENSGTPVQTFERALEYIDQTYVFTGGIVSFELQTNITLQDAIITGEFLNGSLDGLYFEIKSDTGGVLRSISGGLSDEIKFTDMFFNVYIQDIDFADNVIFDGIETLQFRDDITGVALDVLNCKRFVTIFSVSRVINFSNKVTIHSVATSDINNEILCDHFEATSTKGELVFQPSSTSAQNRIHGLLNGTVYVHVPSMTFNTSEPIVDIHNSEIDNVTFNLFTQSPALEIDRPIARFTNCIIDDNSIAIFSGLTSPQQFTHQSDAQGQIFEFYNCSGFSGGFVKLGTADTPYIVCSTADKFFVGLYNSSLSNKPTDSFVTSNFYNNSAENLWYTLDRVSIYGDEGLRAKVGTGTPTDTPEEGTFYVDDTASSEKLFVYVNGSWLSTNLT